MALGRGHRQAAALSWNAALPSTADSYPACLGRDGLTQRLILKAASFRVFLWCGSKESLSWRNCCHQKEALFGEEQGRPAWGGGQATWAVCIMGVGREFESAHEGRTGSCTCFEEILGLHINKSFCGCIAPLWWSINLVLCGISLSTQFKVLQTKSAPNNFFFS